MSDTGLLAAGVFVLLCAGNIAFQTALILGAPWGEITQGGRQRGALDPKGRILAGISIPIIIFQAAAMADAGGLLSLDLARGWGWLAVGICVLTLVLNLITPSRKERMLWAPIAALMCAGAVIVMLA